MTVPWIMFMFGILLAENVVGWFEEYIWCFFKSYFFLFDISHCIAPCQVSMDQCVQYIEFSSVVQDKLVLCPHIT